MKLKILNNERQKAHAKRVIYAYHMKNTNRLLFDEIYSVNDKKLTRGELSAFLRRNKIATNLGCIGIGDFTSNIWILREDFFMNLDRATLKEFVDYIYEKQTEINKKNHTDDLPSSTILDIIIEIRCLKSEGQ